MKINIKQEIEICKIITDFLVEENIITVYDVDRITRKLRYSEKINIWQKLAKLF